MTATIIKVGKGTLFKPSDQMVGGIIMVSDSIKSIPDSKQ